MVKGKAPNTRELKNRPTERWARPCVRNTGEMLAGAVRVDFIKNKLLVTEPLFACL